MMSATLTTRSGCHWLWIALTSGGSTLQRQSHRRIAYFGGLPSGRLKRLTRHRCKRLQLFVPDQRRTSDSPLHIRHRGPSALLPSGIFLCLGTCQFECIRRSKSGAYFAQRRNSVACTQLASPPWASLSSLRPVKQVKSKASTPSANVSCDLSRQNLSNLALAQALHWYTV